MLESFDDLVSFPERRMCLVPPNQIFHGKETLTFVYFIKRINDMEHFYNGSHLTQAMKNIIHH